MAKRRAAVKKYSAKRMKTVLYLSKIREPNQGTIAKGAGGYGQE
jgi:hypothetical protein